MENLNEARDSDIADDQIIGYDRSVGIDLLIVRMGTIHLFEGNVYRSDFDRDGFDVFVCVETTFADRIR